MGGVDKALIWLRGEVKSPPFSEAARVEVGYLLRLLQRGERLSMPVSRPMPSIGPRCHELRVTDKNKVWRIVYYIGNAEIDILDVFAKTTNETPKSIVDSCKRRLRDYLNIL
ncbi:MAG TPA: type II toxin-antitoxin system RelE/ParE family toxin [Blastocatellia bacterium]|nr:type II toxin-antitoxin system RelE/ParE family toxin [Blastocatellia bacterium]